MDFRKQDHDDEHVHVSWSECKHKTDYGKEGEDMDDEECALSPPAILDQVLNDFNVHVPWVIAKSIFREFMERMTDAGYLELEEEAD